ncbi:DNA primase [Aquibium carbonis]|uniref:DNA primase n=1 Tax=Aquibium carbonis TaxID=2495581 RepID=A0A429YYM3_9HYPH|nr:toprim domain-containing protein [Aquibium carbonis]RST86550.1 DNA primase [Aquibium carbonis]
MPRLDASELSRRLGLHAEAACRHYLSNGRRQGNYWLVGNARNAPGRSMFVRLRSSAKGPAGHWTDAATGEHGDMLDIVREALGLVDFKDVAEEARRFLSLPHPEPDTGTRAGKASRNASGSPEAARRLFGMSRPIHGTLAQTYLRGRGITDLAGTASLRFHPRCYYRPDEHSPTETWPAMIAAVTDLHGHLTGAHRTWLAPDGSGKADVDTPRRAMGDLLGHGIRFDMADDVLAASEGIETVLSPRIVLPRMPMLAASSAAHLAAILFPATLRRLYVLRDRDPAGDGARDSLVERASSAGIEVVVLSPRLEDFNEDLRLDGPEALRALIRPQLVHEDAGRFMALAT